MIAEVARNGAADGPATAPAVSVIIPVHGRARLFEPCLAAVLEALGPHDEVIVVADGETDGGWRRARNAPQTRVKVLPKASGAAAARNAGAAMAAGEILFFVDADVLVRSDTIARIRRLFATEPTVAAIVGSYDDAPADPHFHSQYRNLLHHYVHQSAAPELSTFWAGCGAVRREAFVAVGGFDEHFAGARVEDIELGYRLRRRGYRIRLVKDLQVKHLKAWTPASILRTDIFYRAAPWTELILRNGQMENNLNLNYRARASTAAVGLVPAALGLALVRPVAGLSLALALVCLVLALNAGFYVFLTRRQGISFALRAIPWHILYFASSVAGFVVGLSRVVLPVFRSSPDTSPLVTSRSHV